MEAALCVDKDDRKLAYSGKLLKSECVEGKTGDTGGNGGRVDDRGLTPNQELGLYLEGTGKRLRTDAKRMTR